MNAEITATTQPFALLLARDGEGRYVPRKHLLRREPRYSWCGVYMKADKFVPDWIDVTCRNCMTEINRARRQYEDER